MLILLVDNPTESPGQCRICFANSQSNREWWIDTGIMEEFYGAVYYCNVCMTEIANLAGFLSRDQSAELDRDNQNVRKQLKDYEDDIALLGTLGINVNAAIEFVRTSRANSQAVGEGEGILVEREIDADKPLDESGPNDIPSPKSKRKPAFDLG